MIFADDTSWQQVIVQLSTAAVTIALAVLGYLRLRMQIGDNTDKTDRTLQHVKEVAETATRAESKADILLEETHKAVHGTDELQRKLDELLR
jgi:hypothetical protein